jgi:hypothetical protein
MRVPWADASVVLTFFLSQRAQRSQRKEETEAFEGDYMDYLITWIEAYISS